MGAFFENANSAQAQAQIEANIAEIYARAGRIGATHIAFHPRIPSTRTRSRGSLERLDRLSAAAYEYLWNRLRDEFGYNDPNPIPKNKKDESGEGTGKSGK